MIKRLLYVSMFLLAMPAAYAGELKVATWNLNWLTLRQEGLPGNVRVRQPEDFELLRAYAIELNADIVAFQEVDNREAALRVFPGETWSIHMSRDRVRQRVGIAVRRGIRYHVEPDVTSIAIDPHARLRSGVDITVQLPSGPMRILGIHLKTGCQYASLGAAPSRFACRTLLTQRAALVEWIAARREEGVPFLLMGDFNRGMEKRDVFLRTLRAAAPLTRATEGFSNPCWGGETFIDHILLGGPARGWMKPGSLRVMTYRETDPAFKEKLSDHCPVSMRLTVPG